MIRSTGYYAYLVSLGGVPKYIGITTKSVARRWNQHCQNGRRGILAKSISKHGRHSFDVQHIASAWDIPSLNDLEQILVAQYQTMVPCGYNLTSGGNQPITFAPDVIERMTRHFRNPSPKIRANMSLGAKRRYSTPEGKAAQSASQKARWTPEARAKQAERARLQYQKPGAKEAQREKAKGWLDRARELSVQVRTTRKSQEGLSV